VEVWQGGEVEGKLVIVNGEVVWEEGVGLVDGVNFGEAELGDKAVLVGLVGAFDAVLGLGREGRNDEAVANWPKSPPGASSSRER
jgi:hypothetical protein